MDKTEFLEQLRQSLSGRIEAYKVTENVRYYEDYINTQMRMGKTEEEVLGELGSPRLIARTIADTQQDTPETYQEPESDYRQSNAQKFVRKVVRLPHWAKITIVVLLFSLILWLISSVFAFLAPILFPLFVVVLLFKFFKDWLR